MTDSGSDQELVHKKQMYGIDVLRVPHDSQPETEPECMAYSLWYISQYINNKYPKNVVNRSANNLDIDDIRDLMNINSETGWRLDESELEKVAEEIGAIELDIINHGLTTGIDGFKKSIKSNINQDKPVIIILDDIPFRKDRNVEGPRHAVVAVGVSDTEIVLHDPWNGSFAPFPMKDIVKSWEYAGRITVEIEITKQADLVESMQGEDKKND